jgi:bacteriocin-like protein
MKKLALNTKTVEILDDNALQNVQGGKAALDRSCILLSCNGGSDKEVKSAE